ncbi:MAG: sigma-70 family RNA polymerase sigma factor [Planctomycetes bacterium]|nr:sigma-70 family RNA polymerase sigma factor [Planctomycetota bacterium]
MDPNPLLDDSSEAWDRLVGALGPPTMLLAIAARMGHRLSAALTPEDIWQETLLHVWRDRHHVDWQGYPAFRRWVLQVAENRIRNAGDRLAAKKRGGEAGAQAAAAELPPPVSSTTPSRVASHAEEARAMQLVLEELPVDVRDVVRLRLVEEIPVLEVAARLGLGESAVKHRLRKGARMFWLGLRERLALTRGSADGGAL